MTNFEDLSWDSPDCLIGVSLPVRQSMTSVRGRGSGPERAAASGARVLGLEPESTDYCPTIRPRSNYNT